MEGLGFRRECRLLEPKFDFVAIWVCDIGERIARRELALTKDFPACSLNLGYCQRNVLWPLEAKSEMLNAADFAGAD
jgi:hypothetical protein